MQNEVHAKGPARERAKMADLLPQHRRRAKLCLENAESARVAHGSHEFGIRKIGPHGRDRDRSLNSKPFAKPRSQHITIVLIREPNGAIGLTMQLRPRLAVVWRRRSDLK